jgi:Abortive infection alpha
MTEHTMVDLVGVGKVAKAIPQKAWVQIVDTACKTFRDAVAPVTALTSGLGRLIEARFDRLVDVEKVLAADIMARAQTKIAQSKKKPTGQAKARVVVAAIESSASETDMVIRELWSNLLAQEILGGVVHPEFTKILSRLSSQDAQMLAQIAERDDTKSVKLKRFANELLASIHALGVAVLVSGDDNSFIHEHLVSLNLIRRDAGFWALTHTGRAFIQSVSDSGSDEAVV